MAPTELLRRQLQLERVESIPADATVRHVDQLDTETLAAFYEAVENEGAGLDATANLETGEIIVFTEYYRVDGA